MALPGLPQRAKAPALAPVSPEPQEMLVDFVTIPAHQGVVGKCPRCGSPVQTDNPGVVKALSVPSGSSPAACRCGQTLVARPRLVRVYSGASKVNGHGRGRL